MKGTRGRLPLLLGLVLLPLVVIAAGGLIASTSPGGPQLTETHPVQVGGVVREGTSPEPDPADTPAEGSVDGPDTPVFQPNPPATAGSGTSAAQPGAVPTTQVRPPVQRRPAPAPVPYDDDDDDDDDDGDDDDDDDD